MSPKGGVVSAIVAAVIGLHAATASANDLTLTSTGQLDARLQELTFSTPAFKTAQHVRVLLPDGYDPQQRYPVLYLLNGSLDDETSWTEKGNAEALTAGYPLIVVMPNGGAHGAYTDWYAPGTGGPYNWETFHIGELLPWIDQHFPTNGVRAVAGLSMGGGGAFGYAGRFPDKFVAAAAFSGALNTNSLPVQPLTATSGLQEGDPTASVYGDRAGQEIRWRGHNGWDLAENLRGLDLTIRTGNGLPGGPGGDTGDPVEAEVHTESTDMHTRLDALGIPHLFDDYGAGGHAWFYWQRDLKQLMDPLMATFAAPPAPPAKVTYKSIEPSYSVYGWRVQMNRPALEFSELRDADKRGFTLAGSGNASVRTAAVFKRRQRVRATIGSTVLKLHAGRRGRVIVPVTLGPGNPDQAFTFSALQAPGADPDAGTRVYRTTVTLKP
ncbi:MAG: hypothetical protein QOF76_3712 [Solirubrobacteraceae bacterium]|jgi:S-formylglutathione hydrolase FrmB|nr:hypothetical protein [Solirubrobacteraceae bacterium]